MKSQSFLMLFVLLTTASYAQLHFSIDNTNPCVGESVTFSLPSIYECSNPRVLSEADWSVYPTPTRSEVHYNFSALNGVPGYISVTVTYTSYHPTISVHAYYACNGKPAGEISDLIIMRPMVAAPSISGFDDDAYSGDQSTATASAANAVSYSWKLSIVEAVSGAVDQSAIANPTSQQTDIDWPADFVGVVDVTAAAAACSDTMQTTKRVSILTPPSALFYESSVASAHCPGTSMRYRLEVFGGFTVTHAQLITSGGATNISVFHTTNGVPVEWSVKWVSDGEIKVRYSVSNGNRIWADRATSTLGFDVQEYEAGQIQPIPLVVYCAPIDVALSVDRQPTGSPYVFQYCNTGDCGMTSSNWINNNPPVSPMFPAVSINTSFRIKLTDDRCGIFQSAPVSIAVRSAPSITLSDKVIFSGGTFDIPAANTPFSNVTVLATSTGVTGASDASIFQGTESGTLATHTLVAPGPSDGTVVYSVTPSKNGCAGKTEHATVTVYPTPVIDADRLYVYKERKATLRTGSYDSYLWKLVSGTIVGSDPIHITSVPGTYSVTVTKNGAQGTSTPLTIGTQFSGVNENYIISRQPSREFISTEGFENLTERDVMESIQYFDGLGRPLQNIDIRQSPSGRDVVQPFAYDRYGRSTRKFLPYTSSEDNGRIRTNAITSEQPAFYQQHDPTIPFDLHPYSETVFEDSPLDRVYKQGAVGSAWQPNEDHPESEHAVTHEYALNTAADSVIRFIYDHEGETIAAGHDTALYYSAGTLYRNKIIDEDNNDVIEFVDKLDRTICKKVHAGGSVYACTYYVYDDFGDLAVVIPPEGTKAISSSLKR